MYLTICFRVASLTPKQSYPSLGASVENIDEYFQKFARDQNEAERNTHNALNTTVWSVQADLDSKVHGVNMGLTWGQQDPGGPHDGRMNLAIWGDTMSAICKLVTIIIDAKTVFYRNFKWKLYCPVQLTKNHHWLK